MDGVFLLGVGFLFQGSYNLVHLFRALGSGLIVPFRVLSPLGRGVLFLVLPSSVSPRSCLALKSFYEGAIIVVPLE